MTKLTIREAVNERRSMVREALDSDRDALKAMGLTVDQFVQVTATALLKTPSLLNVPERALFAGVVDAAQKGLLPDGRQGALVPMKDRGKPSCQFMPMVGGLLDLARDSLPNTALQAHTVYAGDEFEDVRGSEPRLFHKPDPEADRSAENVTAVYAVAHHAGNAVPEFEVLYRNEIEQFRAMSRARSGGPWASHYAEMAEARALKRLLKRLPVGPRLAKALDDAPVAAEDAEFDGETIDVEPEPEPEPEPAPARKAASKPKTRSRRKPEPEPGPEPEPEPEGDDDEELPEFEGSF